MLVILVDVIVFVIVVHVLVVVMVMVVVVWSSIWINKAERFMHELEATYRNRKK